MSLCSVDDESHLKDFGVNRLLLFVEEADHLNSEVRRETTDFGLKRTNTSCKKHRTDDQTNRMALCCVVPFSYTAHLAVETEKTSLFPLVVAGLRRKEKCSQDVHKHELS